MQTQVQTSLKTSQVLHWETRYASPFAQFATNYAAEVLARALPIVADHPWVIAPGKYPAHIRVQI